MATQQPYPPPTDINTRLANLRPSLPPRQNNEKLVLIEYQTNFTSNANADALFLSKQLRKVAWTFRPGPTSLVPGTPLDYYLTDSIYWMTTYLSGFKHARLVVLEADADTTANAHSDADVHWINGRVYGFTDTPNPRGQLDENERGTVWTYDESSGIEVVGYTGVSFGEVIEIANELVDTGKDYHVRTNNCEVFAERLSREICDERYREQFEPLRVMQRQRSRLWSSSSSSS